MNPETETEIKLMTAEGSLGYDDLGNVFIKKDDGEWDSLKEIDMRIEKFSEEAVLKCFPDALLNDGDQVYVRRIGGRLQWIRGNVYGGGETWNELTPVTAKHLEAMGDYPELRAVDEAETKEELRKRALAESAEKEGYAIGWYQNAEGDLYQYNGSEWLGTVPTKKQIAELEYLG
jgi:hypothetical protein